MVQIASTLSLFFVAFASLASAAPLRRQNPAVTACQLVKMDNRTATCNPAGAFGDECATAERAAGPISAAFAKFGISTVGEKAALLSLMLFETGGFKFDKNHFPAPGRPGQGTRNLQIFKFNLQYALDIPAVAPQAKALLGPITPSSSQAEIDAVPDATKNAVRALVLDDTNSFASAAWFLKASGACAQSFSDGLKTGTVAGWESYITGCVGTTVTDDRRAAYDAALKALS